MELTALQNQGDVKALTGSKKHKVLLEMMISDCNLFDYTVFFFSNPPVEGARILKNSYLNDNHKFFKKCKKNNDETDNIEYITTYT